MPLPTPDTNEEKKKFISRCISELHDKNEFDAKDQKVAVCFSQWERSLKEGLEKDPCWDGYKMVGFKMKDGIKVPNCVPDDGSIPDTKSEEDDDMEEATFKRVNRVRGGKVQKRKKVATKPGYKVQDGKVVKMKASERLKRARGQKRGARKRKAKQSQALRKRKISLKRRKARGL